MTYLTFSLGFEGLVVGLADFQDTSTLRKVESVWCESKKRLSASQP